MNLWVYKYEEKTTDDDEAFGALANAFLTDANHLNDCSGGDGTRCACGDLQAWAEARAAKGLAEQLAHQYEGATGVVEGIFSDSTKRLVLNASAAA